MAAKLSLTIFVVLVAAQVFPSSASYICPPSPCGPLPSCGPCAGPVYTSGPGAVASSSGTYVTGPASSVYVPSSGGYVSSGPQTVYLPGPPPSDCSVPPVFLPPPKFPALPTIHAPNPLTIPLQVPSVIPVGKVCVCKAIQIQPSVVPVAKACACKPACLSLPPC